MTAGEGRVWPAPGRREWLRVSPAADGLVAMTVLPAGVAVAVMHRRARRRDGLLAWRYRTHGVVAADSQPEHDRSWADLPRAEHHRAHRLAFAMLRSQKPYDANRWSDTVAGRRHPTDEQARHGGTTAGGPPARRDLPAQPTLARQEAPSN